MSRLHILSVFGTFLFANLGCVEAAVPDRTILFLMDGLCVGAPEKLPLPSFQGLKNDPNELEKLKIQTAFRFP